MHRILLGTIYMVCACFSLARGQATPDLRGARLGAMAAAGAALQDCWNTAGNPSGIASFREPVAALAYESRFGIPELRTRAATAVLPGKKQVFGINLTFYGGTLYREGLAALSCGRQLSERFRVGIRFSYHTLKTISYPGIHAFSAAAGLQLAPLQGLTLGAYVGNAGEISGSGSLAMDLPLTAGLGFSYAFSEKVIAAAELSRKEERTRLGAGLEYRFHPRVTARGGISLAPFKQYAGLGISAGSFAMDLAVASHSVLGFSPQISISYVF